MESAGGELRSSRSSGLGIVFMLEEPAPAIGWEAAAGGNILLAPLSVGRWPVPVGRPRSVSMLAPQHAPQSCPQVAASSPPSASSPRHWERGCSYRRTARAQRSKVSPRPRRMHALDACGAGQGYTPGAP
eukprot:scaffold112872_cov39-Tisochrysis_lutea.AAC.1